MSLSFPPIGAFLRCFLLGARLLLCWLLPFGCVLLLGSGTAAAATEPDEPAPMCDLNGASVAAGDDIPEVDRGHFEALPCEAQLLFASRFDLSQELGCHAARTGDADPAAPPQPIASPRVRYEAARQLGVPFPERAEPASVQLGERDGLAPSPGHARNLYRPPVARA